MASMFPPAMEEPPWSRWKIQCLWEENLFLTAVCFGVHQELSVAISVCLSKDTFIINDSGEEQRTLD